MAALHTLQGLGERALAPARPFADSLRQPEVVRESGHRPWPLPAEPWQMGQVWKDLLFAHWPVAAEALERVVPPNLPLDRFEGRAWVGVTPFLVTGVRLRGTLPAPFISTFPEINVRTYVRVGDRPGIYFLSLDAGSRAAVLAARRAYRLPYFHARIRTEPAQGGRSFAARRVSADGPAAEFAATYGPSGEPLPVREGSLERWLSERYCLYTLDRRAAIYRGEIQHPPWPLQPAWAEIALNRMTTPFGFGVEGEPLLHFSARQDVALWPLHRLDSDVLR